MIYETKDFITSIFASADPKANIEFRLIGNGTSKQVFFTLDELKSKWDQIEFKLKSLNKKGFNIYFGAQPRSETWVVSWEDPSDGRQKRQTFVEEEEAKRYIGTLPPEAGARVMRAVLGEDANVLECHTIYADLDYRGPLVKKNCEVLKAYNLIPTYTVMTGHGYHLWWKLKEPCSPQEASQVIRQVARVLAGDPSVANPSRIMRLPGTMNVKDPQNPILCEIVQYDTTRQYSITDFEPLEYCADGLYPEGKKPTPIKKPSPSTSKSFEQPTARGNGHGFIEIMARTVSAYWNVVPHTRHKLALGLAGLLRKNDVPEEVALHIVSKVCTLASDEEVRDRENAVRSTYSADINDIGSSTHIVEALGEERAKAFLRDYGTAIDHILPPPVLRARLPDFDLDRCVPDGFLKKYVQYASKKTDAPVQYHAACILTVAAAALGNRVYVDDFHGKKLYPNLYTLLCGPSTRLRKSNSILMTKPIAKAAGITIYPSNATVELLYARLAPEPTEWVDKNGMPCDKYAKGAKPVAWYGKPSGIFFHSEFSHYLSASSKSYMQDSRNFFMDIYDGAPGGEVRETKTQGKYVIEDAAVSMLCGVTMASIKSFLSREDVQNGFLARFLIVMPPNKHENRYGRNIEKEKNELDDLSELSEYLEVVMKAQGPITVAGNADALYTEFDKEMHLLMERHEGTEKEAMASFLGRLSTMAFKIAAVYGCVTNLAPIVDEESMKRAIDMCRYSAAGLECFFDEIRSGENRNVDLQYEDRVVRAVRKAWFSGERPVSQSTIYRACHLTADQIEKAIESACRKGIIFPVPGVRGKTKYILHEKEM